MKSKTAQDHIESLDFWVKVGENRQTLVVRLSDAEKAVEIAEQEMQEKAAKARIATCPYQSDDKQGMCVNGIHCDENCDEIKKFIAQF